MIKSESKNKYNIFKSDVLSLSLVTGEIVEACEKLKSKKMPKLRFFSLGPPRSPLVRVL